MINNSGADVPSETIVRPIINGESHAFLAMPLDPSIKKSAHLINIRSPIRSNTMLM